MKKLLFLILTVNLFVSCVTSKKNPSSIVGPVVQSPVVVIYENDVHCAVEGYAKLATVREELQVKTPYVTTVSCGDYIQGGLVGAVSDGGYIIDVMNKVGYDVVTLGNHEFDFGVPRMFELMKELDASVVNANFFNLQTDRTVFPAYEIRSYGNLKIAFIGLTTTTALSDSPRKFKNEDGRFIYDLSKDHFYETVQTRIDQARKEGADYVVVLSHMGEEIVDDHPNSYSLIAQTTGIDVVLDGHTHHYLPDTLIHNQAGEPVLMSSTGSQFKAVGVLTLTKDGKFQTELRSLKDVVPHSEVQAFVDEINEKVEAEGNEVIGYSEVNLSSHDEHGNRTLRNQEAGLGNFSADAYRMVLETDIALVNGGGIRDSISKGDLTFNVLKKAFPYGNRAATGIMTGQQIIDALEFSVKDVPNEFAEFLHVSGLRFEVNSSIASPVLIDADGVFAGVGNAERRVSNVQVLNQQSGKYEPIMADKEYSVAGVNYLLVEGSGQGILSSAKVVNPDMGTDIEIHSIYIQQHLKGRIGKQYGATEGRILITE